MVCHDVVRLVPSNRLYINSTVVRSGLLTGGLPQCREVGFTRRFMMGLWYGILLGSEKGITILIFMVIVFSWLFLRHDGYIYLMFNFYVANKFRL